MFVLYGMAFFWGRGWLKIFVPLPRWIIVTDSWVSTTGLKKWPKFLGIN